MIKLHRSCSIKIINHTLGEYSIASVLDAVGNCEVHKLTLADCDLTKRGARMLASSLGPLGVKELLISGNSGGLLVLATLVAPDDNIRLVFTSSPNSGSWDHQKRLWVVDSPVPHSYRFNTELDEFALGN